MLSLAQITYNMPVNKKKVAGKYKMEHKYKMEQKKRLFTDREIKEMIVPLFLEQLLVMLVGMADTLVVSYVGEAAVSGALSNGLRAAGDVKFTMYVSIFSTIAVRLLLSYVFGIMFGMGVIGIAIAMVSDWIVRALIFIMRQKSGKWKQFKVIS